MNQSAADQLWAKAAPFIGEKHPTNDVDVLVPMTLEQAHSGFEATVAMPNGKRIALKVVVAWPDQREMIYRIQTFIKANSGRSQPIGRDTLRGKTPAETVARLRDEIHAPRWNITPGYKDWVHNTI